MGKKSRFETIRRPTQSAERQEDVLQVFKFYHTLQYKSVSAGQYLMQVQCSNYYSHLMAEYSTGRLSSKIRSMLN
jgi:hypothetical protein